MNSIQPPQDKQHTIKISSAGFDIAISNNLPFCLIAGPCAMESKEHTLEMAKALKDICLRLDIPFIFKASFDKANRTSIHSKRGVGLDEGLDILGQVKKSINVPVTTDVHDASQVNQVASVVDILQIPALLCRQTDLIIAAAKTQKTVNIKKGQFLSPQDMSHAVNKIEFFGNKNIMLCERGFSFGYNNLVVDMRSLEIMKRNLYPVVFDATHSVQLLGAGNDKSEGQREFVFPLAKAAIAVGVAAIFMEVHDTPNTAICDGPNMIPLTELEDLLTTLKNLDSVVKNTTTS